MNSLGEALRRERQRRSELQRDAASRFGVSQPSYHRWESGESVPADESRQAVAEYLGMTIQEVWELIYDTAPPISLESVQQDVAEIRRELADLKRKIDELVTAIKGGQ